MFEAFFWLNDNQTQLLIGEHHMGFVLLSVLIVILISCMSMQIAGIAKASHRPLFRHVAIGSGAVALGAGIWSMHFIGMLAFRLCTPIRYDPQITVLSVLPAILASWIALEILSRDRISARQLMIGGILVGAGIGAMHYAGMSAMKMAVELRYDPAWFATSIIVAVLMANFALWIRFGLRQQRWMGKAGITVLSGTVMGLAIASMHYVAMRAARFIGEEQLDYQHTHDLGLVIGISVVTVVLGGFVLAGNLISRYRQLYAQLQLSELRQKAMFDTAVDAIITIEKDGVITTVNPSVERLFGWRKEELIGRNVKMLMPEQQRTQHDGYLRNYLDTGIARVIGIGRETTAQRKDGSTFPIRLAVGKVVFEEAIMFVGFITDISEQKRIEKLLEREAHHDALTDLPNRRMLFAILPKAIARADRYNRMFSLLFIDLDGFKRINDTLGHEIGDELLKEVARRLLHVSRRADHVVRLAGDEFVVVLENLKEEGEARQIAEKMLADICKPMVLQSHDVKVQASIGIAFYRQGDRLSADELLGQADNAMYEAKKRGKCGVFSVA